MQQLTKKVCRGNAAEDGEENRQWFVGHFKDKIGPLYDPTLQVKYDTSLAGTRRTKEEASADPNNRTLQLLISGKVVTSFTDVDSQGGVADVDIILGKPGDYCLWEPGQLHWWEFLEDSVTVTLRWPASKGHRSDQVS